MSLKHQMSIADFLAHLDVLDTAGNAYHFTVSAPAEGPMELFLIDGTDRAVTVSLCDDGKWTVHALPSRTAQATHEGWGLFEVDGRLQLQRLDEREIFDTDADAIIFVAGMAASSAYHREAIEKIGRLV